MKSCSNCGIGFESNKKNQKYCTPACCRLATNKKIMERYYESKKRRSGVKRFCTCGQLLSRYNDSNQCYTCLTKNQENNTIAITEVIDNVIKKINKARR